MDVASFITVNHLPVDTSLYPHVPPPSALRWKAEVKSVLSSSAHAGRCAKPLIRNTSSPFHYQSIFTDQQQSPYRENRQALLPSDTCRGGSDSAIYYQIVATDAHAPAYHPRLLRFSVRWMDSLRNRFTGQQHFFRWKSNAQIYYTQNRRSENGFRATRTGGCQHHSQYHGMAKTDRDLEFNVDLSPAYTLSRYW